MEQIFDKIEGDRAVKIAATSLMAYGAYKVACATALATKAFLKYAVVPRKNLRERYGAGSWAVVTGASDGIGKQLCFELASEGFNIVLIARNKQKTDEVAAQVSSQTGVSTKAVIFDFSTLHTEAAVQELKDKLDALDCDISMLFNNVGNIRNGQLHEPNMRKDLQDLIALNVNALTYMSMFLLPRMVAREKRSALFSVTTMFSRIPTLVFGPYGASKAYMNMLTDCIREAYKDKVDVMLVQPHSVISAINPGGLFNSVSAESFCRDVMNHTGWARESSGSWRHALYWWSVKGSPLSPILGPPIWNYFFLKPVEDLIK